MDWTHAGPTVLASFMASLVEFVEALTVVLAVAAVRGWRSAVLGTCAGLAVLLLLVGLFGQTIARIPLLAAQLVIGTLLLMFGLRWLRKAILRYAGAVALHDEEAVYVRESAALRAAGLSTSTHWDRIAVVAAFKIVMLEGIEVVFIVIAVGARGRLLLPASLGAIAALLVVICLGLWLHRPLANVPENALKFGVGVLLAAFGTFWVGEGLRLQWPEADWSLVGLIVAYILVAQLLVLVCRARTAPAAMKTKAGHSKPRQGMFTGVAEELAGLFVDDGVLALGIIVWVSVLALTTGRVPIPPILQPWVFFSGFGLILAVSALRAVPHTRPAA